MPSSKPPCRLFFILAREARVGVVFRRGPSRKVQLLRWDTGSDAIEPGQWFTGRIYERRCDLSPSGDLLVYFAAKQTRRQSESSCTATWTAVSKPPYLTALALWPKGDAWGGGGQFLDERTLALNHGDITHHPSHAPGKHLRVKPQHLCGEDSPLFDARLARDGWRLETRGEWTTSWPPKADPPERTVKPQPGGELTLLRRQHGLSTRKGGHDRTYLESFALRAPGGEETPIDGAEWADWDQRGRLVFARASCLFAANPQPSEPIRERLIADLNDATPVAIKSPKWACQW
ncbi:MAG: hypothetical protein NTW19_17225 [Planctomycetota bacterium]|nr:hypothetical protein [Planctomycetota bacterium]